MIKSFFGLTVLLVYFPGIVQAQDCLAKFDSAISILAATPSFRAQVVGEKKTAYDQMVVALRSEASRATTNPGCFATVAKLFDPISDNHLDFYEMAVPALDPLNYKDKKKVDAYRSLPVFKGWPVWSGNVSSLEKRMQAIPADSIEGVYYFADQLKIAVTRTVKKDSLAGVVLESKIPFWQKGQVLLQLKEYAPFRFRAVFAQPFWRNWGIVKNEKWIDGTFTQALLAGFGWNERWKKNPSAKDFRNLPSTVPEMQLKWLDTSTQYLRLGNFRTYEEDLIAANKFYDSISDKVTAGRLVLDLRNNGGGGFKNSRRVLNQLEKFARQKKIYVLVNNRTVSNAEQFLVLLKYSPNLIMLGEPTCGKITYGTNQAGLVHLPGHSWVIYITDIRETGNLLQYEDVGIQPHVYLKNDRDWIAQAMEFANNGDKLQ